MTLNQDYSFGSWIRHRRRTLDLTQPELAGRLHCSVNTIKKIETDARRPSKQLAELLAIQLDIPEKHQSLFVECARGLRPVDALQLLKRDQASDLSFLPLRLKPNPQPVPVSSIIGRETDLEALTRLLQTARLVTITGPGGMGKSTLAQAAMADFQARGVRVVFVSLVGINSAEYIPQAVASALGLALETDPKQQTLDYLQTKRTLLIFDNFEHILVGASFIVDILEQTKNTTILTTSRERLRLREEQVFPLQGLRYPEKVTSGDLDMYPAASLFLTAARRLVPDFDAPDSKEIIRICQITEGLPLALEMAASWVDTLSLAEVAAGLNRNLDFLIQDAQQTAARHRSMRAVFDSSWQLLSETEREVFSRLCVFRGGFTRLAAEAVAGAKLGVLAALVRRSMLKLDPGNGRYLIHELLRLYGEDHLKSINSFREAQRSHLDFFLKQAETAHAFLHTAEQNKWFEHLDAEQDNIRAALSSSFSEPELIESALRLVMALFWYWRIRSRVVEGRQWAERALQAEPKSVEVNATLHFHAGHFGWMQHDAAFARTHQKISLELWLSLGEAGVNGTAYAVHALGMVANLENDVSASTEQFLISVPLFEKSQDAWGLAFVQMGLGTNALWTGDLDSAEKYLQESEKYFRQCGDDWALGLLLGFYGWIEFQRRDFEKAKSIAEETLVLRQALGHAHSVIDSIELLVEIALAQGDRETARQFVEFAIEISDEIGNHQFLTEFRTKLADLKN